MNVLHKFTRKPKYYLAFPVIVAALLSTSIIQVPCPVCHGTGYLSHSVGMENIRIVSVDSRILGSTQDACSGYIVTRAIPIFTVTNTSSTEAEGYLALHLVDLDTNKTLSSLNLAIKVAPNALSVIESRLAFAYNTADIPPEEMAIQAEVSLDNIPCIACNGKSKISANLFPLISSYEDSFVNIVRSSSEYGAQDWVVIGGQRVQIGSEEWLAWMELS